MKKMTTKAKYLNLSAFNISPVVFRNGWLHRKSGAVSAIASTGRIASTAFVSLICSSPTDVQFKGLAAPETSELNEPTLVLPKFRIKSLT